MPCCSVNSFDFAREKLHERFSASLTTSFYWIRAICKWWQRSTTYFLANRAWFNIKTVFTGMQFSLKIRRSWDHLIFLMGIHILARRHLYIKTAPGHKGVKHDDVIKWKNFPRHWPFARGIHRSPVNSPHKGQWRGALMLSLICARINGWVSNRDAGE